MCRPDIRKRWRLNSSNKARRGLGPHLSLSMLGAKVLQWSARSPQTQIWKQVEDQVLDRAHEVSPYLLLTCLSGPIPSPTPSCCWGHIPRDPWIPPGPGPHPSAPLRVGFPMLVPLPAMSFSQNPIHFPRQFTQFLLLSPILDSVEAFIISPTPNCPLPYYSMFLPSILHNQKFSYIFIYWLFSVSSQLES